MGSATAGVEIWVARGVYTLGINVADTFQLVDGVAIYGGFAATETLLTQRNWESNLTILSGDIDGDDVIDSHEIVLTATNQVGNNNNHVVISVNVSNATILDGFTITAGQSNTFPHSGGGLDNDGLNVKSTRFIFH